jgi:hypothetical protein
VVVQVCSEEHICQLVRQGRGWEERTRGKEKEHEQEEKKELTEDNKK